MGLHVFTRDSLCLSRLRDKSKTVCGDSLCRVFLLCLPSNYCPIVPPLFVSLLIYSHHTLSSHKDFGCVFHTTTQRAASLRHLPGFLPHCGVLAHMPSFCAVRCLPSHPAAMPSQQPQVPCFAFFFSLHSLPSCVLSPLLI